MVVVQDSIKVQEGAEQTLQSSATLNTTYALDALQDFYIVSKEEKTEQEHSTTDIYCRDYSMTYSISIN